MPRFLLTAQLKLAPPSNIRQVVNQINAGLQGIKANITINTQGLNSQLSNITRNVRNTSQAVRAAGNDMERFGEQAAIAIRRYGGFTIATTAFLKLGNAISSGVSDAIAFDREIVRIAQVTGHSVGGLKDLNKEVTKLATEFGVSSTKILETSVTLAQAGLSAKDVKIALTALAKTGVSATFGDIKNTTEASIAIMQQFGKEAKDLEGILSSVNAVSAKFAVESEDIAVAVRRAGAAFAAAGGNFDEFQALFTSVRQTTRESAESIATGLRTVFTRIQRPRTQDFLKSFGIDLRDVEGQFVGPLESVKRLSEALKNISTTDPRFAQIIEELGGFRQISKVIPLITKFDITQQALNVSLRGGNSLTKDAEVAQQSLAVQLTKVKEEFLGLIRALSSSESFRGMVDISLSLASSFIKVTESLTPLLPLLSSLAGIKIFSNLRGIATGFARGIPGKHDGGYIHKFARGGLVPGQGNGDTVPAMLSPGEFVIRKDAVKAIGADRLHNINGYARGGRVKGGVGFRKKGFINYNYNDVANYDKKYDLEYGSGESEYMTKKEKLLRPSFTPSTSFSRLSNLLMDRDVSDKVEVNTKTINKVVSNNPNDLNYRERSYEQKGLMLRNSIQREVDALNVDIERLESQYSGYVDKSGPKYASDRVTLGILKSKRDKLQKESDTITSDPASFGRKTIFNDINNLRRETTAKRLEKNILVYSGLDADSDKSIDSQTDGGKIGKKFALSRFLSASTSLAVAEGFVKAGSNTVLRIRAFKGQPIGVTHNDTEQEVVFPNRSQFEITNSKSLKHLDGQRRYLFVDRLAKGGFPHGQGTDTVPAMLTPGEFVINKQAAQELGPSTLHSLNNADKVRKFASGGPVQHLAGGGFTAQNTLSNPFVITGALSIVQQLVSHLASADSEIIKFVSSLGQAAFQFGILKGVAEGLKSVLPQSLTKGVPFSNTSPISRAEARKLQKTTGLSNSEIIANNRQEITRNKIAAGIGVGFGVAGVVGGQLLSDSGNKEIAAGTGGVGKARAGEILSTIGAFAAAGSSLGPLGAAAGAAAGLLTGLSNTVGKFEKELDNVKFNKKLEEFGKTIDKFSTGKLSASDVRLSVLNTVNETEKRSAGPDGQDVKARFSNDAIKVEQFIQSIAKDSKSFEELEKSTGNLINQFSILTNVPYAQLKTELERLISSANKAANTTKLINDLAQAEYQTAILLSAMSESINKVNNSFSAFDSSLTNASNFLGGRGASFQSKDIESIIDKISRGRFSDTGEITRLGSQTFGVFGKAGDEQVAKLAESARALSELPSVLLEVRSKGSLSGDSNSFADSLDKVLDERGFSPSVRNSLVQGTEAVIGPDQNSQNIINKINANLSEVAGEIGKSLNGTVSLFKEFGPAFKTQVDRIRSAFEVYTQAQIKVADYELELSKRSETFKNIKADVTGNIRSSSDVLSAERARVLKLGGSTSSSVLGTRLGSLKDTANGIANQLAESLDVSEQEKLGGQLAKVNTEIYKTTKALEELSNSSDGLNAIQKEIALEEEKRKFKESLVLTAIFGSREAKQDLNRKVGFTSVAATRGLDFIPENERAGVLDLLQSAGKQKINNVPADELLKRIAQSSSVGRRLGDKVVDGSLTAGANSQDSLLKLQSVLQSQEDAVRALSKDAANTGDIIAKAIATQNQKFLNDLSKVFNEKQIAEQNTKISGFESEQTGLTRKRTAVQSLSFLTGVNVNDSNKASVVGLKDSLDQLAKLMEERARLSKSVDLGIAAGSTTEGLSTAIRLAANKQGFSITDNEIANLRIKQDSQNIPGEGLVVDEKRFRELAPNAKLTNDEAAQLQKSFNELAVSRNKASLSKNSEETAFVKNQLRGSDVGRNTLNNNANLTIETIKGISKSIGDSLKVLGNESIDNLKLSVDRLTESINEAIKNRDSIPLKKAMGGHIPGVGNTDTIPAMLTPGEFVLKKSAVESIGIDNLYAMNNGYNKGGKVRRFARGGFVDHEEEVLQAQRYQEIRNIGFRKQSAKILKDIQLSEETRQLRNSTRSRQERRNKKQLNELATPNEELVRVRKQAEEILNRKSGGYRLTRGEGAKQLENEARIQLSKVMQAEAGQTDNNKLKEQRVRELRRQFAVRNAGGTPSNSLIGSQKEDPSVRKARAIQKMNEAAARKSAKVDSIPSALSPVNSGNDIDSSASRITKLQNAKFAKLGITREEYQLQKAHEKALKRNTRASGGSIGFNSGGHVGGSSSVSVEGLNELRSVVQQFSTVVGNMSSKLEQFKDLSISLNATHKVEVIFNGAEILSKLQPEIARIAVEQAKDSINRMIDAKFPDVGRVNI